MYSLHKSIIVLLSLLCF